VGKAAALAVCWVVSLAGLQRYKVLFICGNYSHILSRLNRNITELEVRRAFTSFQLMTILEENHHSFII
jgi:DNA polymerase I